MPYFVYMLECADFSFYTGFTTNLEARLLAHNSGKGARYTRARRPCRLVYVERFAEKRAALSREWHIKHTMTRAQKEELICAHRHSSECSGGRVDDEGAEERICFV
ncbi:MAG: GIY-YIG nuclease family protein [Desulfovibrionaceae bacterium]|nr:GIY-YIG nuclease family protein [Desulfovibrionaceae bacterium]